VPSECVNLLEETQKTLLSEVALGSHEEKIKDFLEKAQDIVFELLHIEAMSQSWLYRLVKDNYSAFQSVNLGISILINLALFLSFRAASTVREIAEVDQDMRLVIFVLGIVNVVLATLVALFTLVSRAPLIKNRLVQIRRTGLGAGHGLNDFTPTIMVTIMLLAMTGVVYIKYPETVPQLLVGTGCVMVLSSLSALRLMWTTPVSDFSINYCWVYDTLCENRMRWQVTYVIASLLGTLVHPVAFAFLLFDICMVSPTLQSVLKSILQPAHHLGMTAILVFILVYVFSFVSVIGFRRSLMNSLAFGNLDPEVPMEEQDIPDASYDCQKF
jgi:hypothetical protein